MKMITLTAPDNSVSYFHLGGLTLAGKARMVALFETQCLAGKYKNIQVS